MKHWPSLMLMAMLVINASNSYEYNFRKGPKTVLNAGKALIVNSYNKETLRRNAKSFGRMLQQVIKKLETSSNSVEKHLIKIAQQAYDQNLQDYEKLKMYLPWDSKSNESSPNTKTSMEVENKDDREKRSIFGGFVAGILATFGVESLIKEFFPDHTEEDMKKRLNNVEQNEERFIHHFELQDKEISHLENGLNRLGKKIQFMKVNWRKSEETLVIMHLIQTESIRLHEQFSIVFDTIELGKLGKINMDFYDLGSLQKSFQEITSMLAKKGQEVVSPNVLELMKSDVAIVITTEGFYKLVAVPTKHIDDNFSSLQLNAKGFYVRGKLMTFQPDNDVLVMDFAKNQFIETNEGELERRCKMIGEFLSCDGFNIVRKDIDNSCLYSMYKNHENVFSKICKKVIINEKEKVSPNGKENFSIYNPMSRTVDVKCQDGTDDSFQLDFEKNLFDVHVPQGCWIVTQTKVVYPHSKTFNVTAGNRPFNFNVSSYEDVVSNLAEKHTNRSDVVSVDGASQLQDDLNDLEKSAKKLQWKRTPIFFFMYWLNME